MASTSQRVPETDLLSVSHWPVGKCIHLEPYSSLPDSLVFSGSFSPDLVGFASSVFVGFDSFFLSGGATIGHLLYIQSSYQQARSKEREAAPQSIRRTYVFMTIRWGFSIWIDDSEDGVGEFIVVHFIVRVSVFGTVDVHKSPHLLFMHLHVLWFVSRQCFEKN
jgi:hypothetical protein